MIDNPFEEFVRENLSIHVADEEEWDRLLDILETEEGLCVGFTRSQFRHKRFFYVYYDCDYQEVHCGSESLYDNAAITFNEMVNDRWPYLVEKIPVNVDIGQLF